jgi:hypothetical protein
MQRGGNGDPLVKLSTASLFDTPNLSERITQSTHLSDSTEGYKTKIQKQHLELNRMMMMGIKTSPIMIC